MFSKTTDSHEELKAQGYEHTGKTASGKHHKYKHKKSGHEVHKEVEAGEDEKGEKEMPMHHPPMHAGHHQSAADRPSAQDDHILRGLMTPGGHAGHGRTEV